MRSRIFACGMILLCVAVVVASVMIQIDLKKKQMSRQIDEVCEVVENAFAKGQEYREKQAIERGYGRYTVDKDKIINFEWIEKD